jgi:o-succinylbenzoate synthase
VAGPDIAHRTPAVHCQVAHGRALFNQGDFWGCHESLELAWHRAPPGQRVALQGVIQAAAALHKYVVQDNPGGALRLVQRALGNLAGVPDDLLGLDLTVLRAELLTWEDRLARVTPTVGSVVGLPHLAWSASAAAARISVAAARIVAVVHEGRPAVLVALDDGAQIGWGECRVAWDAHGLWEALVDGLAPAVLLEPLAAPTEVPVRARGLAALPSAVAGLEAAAWDLYARRLGVSLNHALGIESRPVPLLGRAVGTGPAELAASVKRLAAAGCRRVLVPARPNADRRVLPWLVADSPIPVAIDLGGAYRMADIQALVALDSLGTTMLARPFPVEAVDEAVRLRRLLTTPVSMGPWVTERQLAAALALAAMDVVEVDPGLCGLTAALRMAEDAATARRPVWVSSSAATPVGAAADLAYAAHGAATLPADLGRGVGWVGQAAVSPVPPGSALPLVGPGLGVVPARDWLDRVAVRELVLRA